MRNLSNAPISIDYTIKVCSSIDNGCSEQDIQDNLGINQQIELYVRDEVSEKGSAESVFYKLDLYQNNLKSNKDIWNSTNLVETKNDESFDYVLTVDQSFFQ